jgi:hypothetical protein
MLIVHIYVDAEYEPPMFSEYIGPFATVEEAKECLFARGFLTGGDKVFFHLDILHSSEEGEEPPWEYTTRTTAHIITLTPWVG